MLEYPLKWLQRNWWGIIISYLLLLISTYLIIWQFAEPLGIPDTIDQFPSFSRTRIFLHLVLTLVIASHLTLILDLISRFKKQQIPSSDITSSEKQLLERIGYESTDTPIDTCWDVSNEAEKDSVNKPVFKQIIDGYQGEVLQVTSTSRYAADYKVKPQASLGKLVKFTSRFDDNSARLYTQVQLLSKDGSGTCTLWLNIMIGEEKPKQLWRNESSFEWSYFTKPLHIGGQWLHLTVDLVKAVEETIGRTGWKLGQIKRCRIRGNISLAHISIYD